MTNKPPPGVRPETLAVAFGYDPHSALGSVKPPIYMTSTFVYPSAQHAKDVHEGFFDGTGPLAGQAQYIYSRLGHPGLDILEARLAAIDGAEAAAAFSSGMAAHSSVALAFVGPGDSVLHGRPIYGGVDLLYNLILSERGVHAEAYLDGTDEEGVHSAICRPRRGSTMSWSTALLTSWLCCAATGRGLCSSSGTPSWT